MAKLVFTPGERKAAAGLPLLFLALTVLGVITTLGYCSIFTPGDTMSYLLALVAVVGATGIGVLVTAIPNSTLIIHLLFTIALLVAVVVLTVHNIFSAADIKPIMAVVLGGGAAGVGINQMTNVIRTVPRTVPELQNEMGGVREAQVQE